MASSVLYSVKQDDVINCFFKMFELRFSMFNIRW